MALRYSSSILCAVSPLQLNSTNTLALTNAMDFVKNPQEMCSRIHVMIREITAKIRSLKAELKARGLSWFNKDVRVFVLRHSFVLKCELPIDDFQKNSCRCYWNSDLFLQNH